MFMNHVWKLSFIYLYILQIKFEAYDNQVGYDIAIAQKKKHEKIYTNQCNLSLLARLVRINEYKISSHSIDKWKKNMKTQPFISELRILGPNSARNVSQSSAWTLHVKPGPTYQIWDPEHQPNNSTI